MTESLRARALRLLARRDYSRDELTRRLTRDGDTEGMEDVLQSLESAGLLSDARYAEHFVASRAARFGVRRLRQDLRQRGVGEALADEALAALETDDKSRAAALWLRKFGQAPADARDYARQARFLHARGFSADIIRQILRDPPHDDQ